MCLSLSTYLSKVLENFNQKQTINNTKDIVNQIITHKSIQLWKISKDKREFERFSNLLNGKLKNVLDVSKLNASMQSTNLQEINGKYSALILHDPSDIRKKYSEKMEHIGWVKDENGKWIRGYRSFNSVWLDNCSKQLHLLANTPYSNQDPDYVSKKELQDYEKGKLAGTDRAKEIERALSNIDNHNLSTITRNQLASIHTAIRLKNTTCVITHVLDREFVDFALFDFIDQDLEDDFIVRLKRSNLSNEHTINEKGNQIRLRLSQKKDWKHRTTIDYKKIQFKKKVYHNARADFSWDTVVLDSSIFWVVRIRFYDSQGRRIFKDDMLLITNKKVRTETDALFIWQQYMKRMKIEGVFRFCKQVLGWEEFLVRDFELIKNLICLCFFVGGYFYEMEDELIKDHTIQWIAELGGGKGKVTRYYFLEGIKNLLIMKKTQAYIKNNNISKQQLEDAYELFTLQ